MLHDQQLLDILSELPQVPFEGESYRTTRGSLDPTSPSTSGGRWAPPAEADVNFPTLYTSLTKDGAMAEVASYLVEQLPIPREQSLIVSRLAITAQHVVRLAEEQFHYLGIDRRRFGERDYLRTQQIGAALSFLGVDGLLAPSARWDCQNLIVFADNHSLADKLEVISSEEMLWRAWAAEHGLL